MDEYFICPVCGTEVESRAPACPECGSDKDTGWSDDTIYDGLDLPGYGDNEDEEMEKRGRSQDTFFGSRMLFLIITLLCILAFVLYYLL